MYDIIKIRPIIRNDNKAIATIIKNTLIEFDGKKPGTAYYDKSTTSIYEAYQAEGEVYYVALLNNEIIGGCGIKKLKGVNDDICELQKMYIVPKARGIKIGKQLLDKCIDFSKRSGYEQCYLETFPHMDAAIKLYKENNFYAIKNALGSTGHTACDVWLLRDLND